MAGCGEMWTSKSFGSLVPYDLAGCSSHDFCFGLASFLAAVFLSRCSTFLASPTSCSLHWAFSFTLMTLYTAFSDAHCQASQTFFWRAGGDLHDLITPSFNVLVKSAPHWWSQGLLPAWIVTRPPLYHGCRSHWMHEWLSTGKWILDCPSHARSPGPLFSNESFPIFVHFSLWRVGSGCFLRWPQPSLLLS